MILYTSGLRKPLYRTLEEVTSAHVGAASGLFMTTVETSATLGVAVIGLLYAALMIDSIGISLAFVLTMLLIALFSIGSILLVRLLEARKF